MKSPQNTLAALALVLVLSACGGLTTDPLQADFALGPASVRRAVAARFSGTIAPDAEKWPLDAPAITTDVVSQTDLAVDVASRKAGWGSSIAIEGATLAALEENSPFEATTLFVGPLDATGPDAEGVRRVAHAAVPRVTSEASPLIWEPGGRETLEAALLGGLDVEQGTRFTLFLVASATVSLVPGGPLPGGEAAGGLRVLIPVRSGP